MRQIRIRIKFHRKLRRPPLAIQPRVHSLKKHGPAGNVTRRGTPYAQGFLRIGVAPYSFEAFAAPFKASCVASIASPSESLYEASSGPFASSIVFSVCR